MHRCCYCNCHSFFTMPKTVKDDGREPPNYLPQQPYFPSFSPCLLPPLLDVNNVSAEEMQRHHNIACHCASLEPTTLTQPTMPAFNTAPKKLYPPSYNVTKALTSEQTLTKLTIPLKSKQSPATNGLLKRRKTNYQFKNNTSK